MGDRHWGEGLSEAESRPILACLLVKIFYVFMCMCSCVSMNIHVCPCVCTHVSLCVCMFEHVFMCVCILMCSLYAHVCLCAYSCVLSVHVCVFMYVGL